MLRPPTDRHSAHVACQHEQDGHCSPDTRILTFVQTSLSQLSEIEDSLCLVAQPFCAVPPKHLVPSNGCRSALRVLDEMCTLVEELGLFLRGTFQQALGFTRHYSRLSFLCHRIEEHATSISDLINSYWTATLSSPSSGRQQHFYIATTFEKLFQAVAEVRCEAKYLADETTWKELEDLLAFVDASALACPCSRLSPSERLDGADQEEHEVSSQEAGSFEDHDSAGRILSFEHYRKKRRTLSM
jgi:hypothetical protein